MKTFTGKVVSTKMKNTVVVEVEFLRAHPLYKKVLKKHKRLKADTNQMTVKTGDVVKIEEIRPMSRDKHFKVVHIITNQTV